MNQGKIFERDFAKSVPDYVLLYRIPDAAQSFGGTSNLRFSRKNPFDFFLFDSKNRILYGIEAKTVKGKSISFERNKDEHGEIHYHQIEGLMKYNKYENAIFGFVIEFRQIETTVFIDIDTFQELTDKLDKKSFNYGDLEGLPYFVIPQKKLRTNYRYDIDTWLQNYAFQTIK